MAAGCNYKLLSLLVLLLRLMVLAETISKARWQMELKTSPSTYKQLKVQPETSKHRLRFSTGILNVLK